MVNQDRVTPPLGDRPLRGVIGVVDVEVGDGPDGDVGEAGVGEGDRFPREELEVSVRADVDDHVRAERLLDVAIGREVLVCRRNARIVEDPADLAVAPRAGAPAFGLDADEGVSVAHPGDDDPPLVDHRRRDTVHLLARRLTPRFTDAGPDTGGKGLEPGRVVFRLHQRKGTAFPDDLRDRGPAEIADRLSLHDGLDQVFSALRVLDRIPPGVHRFEDSYDAFQRIEVRPGPDRRLDRGAGLVVEE